MSEREELLSLIESTGPSLRLANAILAAGYRKPRTISTLEEVDALPRKAVVMTAFGDALTIYRSPRIPVEHYHFIVTDGLTATVLHEGPEKVTD